MGSTPRARWAAPAPRSAPLSSRPASGTEVRPQLRFDGGQIWIGDQKLILTRTESVILRALVDQAGTAIASAELLGAVGYTGGSRGARAIPMHVARLRAKLGDPPNRGAYIVTVRSVGYMLDPRAIAAPRVGTLSSEEARMLLLEEGLCAAWELITGTVPDQPGVRSWYMENLSAAVEDILTRRPNLRSASPAGPPGEASRA